MKFHDTQHKAALTVITLSLLLAACSKKIDYREAVNQRGLVYRSSENTPFNGVIKNEQWGTSYPEIATGSCATEYKEGLKDGKMLCTSSTGVKMVESEWREGKKNGTEKLWEANTGKFWRETHYKDGKKEGLEEVHNPYENEVLIQKIDWADNQKSGSEKAWDITGKTLLKNLTWVDGKQTGTVNYDTWQNRYKNGKPDGVQKTYDFPADFNQSQALAEISRTADRNVDKLVGGSYFMGSQPGMVVSKEETYVDGVWQVKPKNQACVNAKMAEYQADRGKSVIIGNAERIDWERACEQAATVTNNPKFQACIDAKIAAFRKELGQDAPINHDALDEWEKQCLRGQ